jgi:protein SCO1/2
MNGFRAGVAILLAEIAVVGEFGAAHGQSAGPGVAHAGAPIPGLPGIGGAFQLTDQDGKARTDEEFRGKLLLVTFGYTDCPDICLLDLQNVSAALNEAGPEIAAETVPLFISIDAEHDTPQRLKQFVRQFSPDIIGLTGTRWEIGRIAAAYRVHMAMAHQGSHDVPEHSDFQYLMGRDGKLLSIIPPGTSAPDIAARLRKYAADRPHAKEPS